MVIVSVVLSTSVSIGMTPTGSPAVEVSFSTAQAYVDQNGDGEISWIEALCWCLDFFLHNVNIPD
jgi:hypothetical protein